MSHDPIDARQPRWPADFKPTAGVAYVATGPAFLAEARAAAARLRESNPGVPICLITDQQPEPGLWDEVVLVRNPHFGFRDKILMGACPFERFLFLDTDTIVRGDLSGVFDLLRNFDFAAHQLFEGHDCPLPGVPDAFPEFNSGVLGFRRSPALGDFFAQWLANYDAFYALNAAGQYHYSNVSDQKSLRQTVYASNLRIAVLGPEYNFIPHHVNFACARVTIVHGRGWPRLEKLARRLNARVGNRAYVPRLDAVVSNDMPGPELLRLWAATSLQLVRWAAVGIVPLRLRSWLRRSRLVRRLFLRDGAVETSETGEKKWHRPSQSGQ